MLSALVIIAPAQFTHVDDVASPASIKLNRERGLNMLGEIKDVLKQRYYDKNFRGIDLDARFKTATQRIKQLDTNWQIFRAIAQVLIEFNDSHTRFIPPRRANRVEYGFSMQMIGNSCYVVDVKKGSDAEKKGLRVGDVISAVGQFQPTRENLWKMEYILYALDPIEILRLSILNPDGSERDIEIRATFKSIDERRKESEKRQKEKQEKPFKCQSLNSEVIACKLLTFSVDKKYVDQMMKEVSKHKKLVLDLRGNGGGYVKIEEYLTGHFFDHDIKIADFVTRDKTKERIAKTQKGKVFNGELVVLIDSDSASASEVFSRTVQIQRRGKVVGDVSAGAVMTSNFITIANSRGVPGYETLSFFGVNVTVADLIMSDGKRLEGVGVIPDVLIGPTAKALLQGSDPILSYAAGLLGANISPDEAGRYYFLTKKPEDEEKDSDEGDGDF